MGNLILAGAAFLVTHLGISSTPLRGALVRRLGEYGYLALYSLISFATIGWLIVAFNHSPHTRFLWPPAPALHTLAIAVMPVAFVFAIGAFLGKNPSIVGQEKTLQSVGAGTGLIRVTRHPFQWAVVIWALLHILANGDLAALVFFGSLGLVSLLGTTLIDRKKAASLGEDWQRFAGSSSNLPFMAILGGRNRLALGELWLPVVLGLALYALVLWQHKWVSGVSLLAGS